MNGIHTNAGDVTASRVLLAEPQPRGDSAENSFGHDVSVRQSVKCQNGLIGGGQQDFIVYRVDADLACRTHAFYLRFISLDNPKRRFLSIGCSAECQDGLGQRTRHGNFIVNRVKRDVVHCPAEQ